ncbi:MupG family TIM beta-alpha barrel fold protein [Mycoplasma sp. ATU-Cv-508]|uniref:MupG family TIM beta-alpha barrel fold protein n=1 Tax=Mycoplasma sp. ATU-Cv-508 TaxID=2048001 RepID=UPI000FDF5C1F
MAELGIAIYPEKAGEKPTLAYLKKAAQAGFKRVFVNLLETSDDPERLKMLTNLLGAAQKLGFSSDHWRWRASLQDTEFTAWWNQFFSSTRR